MRFIIIILFCVTTPIYGQINYEWEYHYDDLQNSVVKQLYNEELDQINLLTQIYEYGDSVVWSNITLDINGTEQEVLHFTNYDDYLPLYLKDALVNCENEIIALGSSYTLSGEGQLVTQFSVNNWSNAISILNEPSFFIEDNCNYYVFGKAWNQVIYRLDENGEIGWNLSHEFEGYDEVIYKEAIVVNDLLMVSIELSNFGSSDQTVALVSIDKIEGTVINEVIFSGDDNRLTSNNLVRDSLGYIYLLRENDSNQNIWVHQFDNMGQLQADYPINITNSQKSANGLSYLQSGKLIVEVSSLNDGAYQTKLNCLDLEGTLIWENELEDRIIRRVVDDYDNLYLLGENEKLYKIDSEGVLEAEIDITICEDYDCGTFYRDIMVDNKGGIYLTRSYATTDLNPFDDTSFILKYTDESISTNIEKTRPNILFSAVPNPFVKSLQFSWNNVIK